MTPASAPPLALLAFDHRGGSFSSIRPDRDVLISPRHMRQAKEVIFDAFIAALETGLETIRPGLLVDEEFGANIARRAKAAGVVLAMPVESAGAGTLQFAYGDAFREHISAFAPDYAKVLVRLGTRVPQAVREDQLDRLRTLSDWLGGGRTGLMLELILQSRRTFTGHEQPVPDNEDPFAVAETISEIQNAGIRVDIWKLEGLSSAEGARMVAARARGGPWPADCVILGAAAPARRVRRWLNVAATTDGFVGFAIGRSIWGAHISDWLDGTANRETVVERIARDYLEYVQQYLRYGSTKLGRV